MEKEIQDFWQSHPCGDTLVGGLREESRGDYEKFFRQYDAYRYAKEGHILECLDGIDFKGLRVLEIGLGQGADGEQLIRRGALWSGVDLTRESIDRVKVRLKLRGLPFGELKQGSVLDLPFPDNSFDIVFSHGVLHHVPQIHQGQREIARVLKPDGELVAMLYAKWSLNYLLAIGVIRRAGLLALKASGSKPSGIVGQHLENASKVGLANYLKLSNFIHVNTDGPLNPYSKVYGLTEVKNDFPDFSIIRSYKRFMHAPPLKLGWLPLDRLLGWHLWVHLRPRKSERER